MKRSWTTSSSIFFGSDEKKAFYEMSDRIIEIHDMLQDLKK